MILDDFNQLSRLQAITATAPSADTIDLGPLGGTPTANLIRNIGVGEEIYLVIRVGQGFNTLTSLTVDQKLSMCLTCQINYRNLITTVSCHFIHNPLSILIAGTHRTFTEIQDKSCIHACRCRHPLARFNETWRIPR